MAGRAKHAGPAGHPMSTASDKRPDHRRVAASPDAATDGPRLVLFDVPTRRDLARRAAAGAPGLRFASRRSWTDDPGDPRRPLLGGDPPVGVWHWSGTAEEFAAQAGDVLLRLVHPLVGRGLPFCLGFSFAEGVLEPRSLAVGDAAALDLEDIGSLLRAAAAPAAVTTAPRRPPQAHAACRFRRRLDPQTRERARRRAARRRPARGRRAPLVVRPACSPRPAQARPRPW